MEDEPGHQKVRRHTYSKEWPGFLRDETAARYFDMTLNEFMKAVAVGDLPLPYTIDGHDRWKKSDLDEVGKPQTVKPWRKGM